MRAETVDYMPERLKIAGYPGSLADYLNAVEAEYRMIVQESPPELFGRTVRAAPGLAADGRDLTFWHLITGHGRRSMPGERSLSLWRCSLMPQVRVLLDLLAADDMRTVWWLEGGRRPGRRRARPHLYVAPLNLSFVTVLRKYREWELTTVFGVRFGERMYWMERAARSCGRRRERERGLVV